MFGIASSIRMLALGGFISVAAAGYWYYTKSQEQITHLQNRAAQSDAAIQIQKNFISKQSELLTDMTDNVELIQDIQNELVAKQRDSAKEVSELKNKFNKNSGGGDRDLGLLAAAKPALIQKIVNDAIDTLGTEIEEITQ
jgi:hypothetical protein